MKIEITYQRNPDSIFPCSARAELNGEGYFGVGATWQSAKESLISRLETMLNQTPPPAKEEVEI